MQDLNDQYVALLNQLTGTGAKSYKVTELNQNYEMPDGNRLDQITFINPANTVKAIDSTGFFGLRHNVDIWCKDMPPDTYFTYFDNYYHYDPEPRPDYQPDKTAKVNFQTGKWYYNARDIYEEARRKGMPCLFIYSLFGCGPCAVYQKKLWNSEQFQIWFSKQKFLLAGLECEQQPVYDEHLRFLVDELSPNALNFAKEDQGETL